jgi:hypothetical protein
MWRCMYVCNMACWILLEWEMFQTKFVEEVKTHIIQSFFFFLKVVPLWYNVGKYGTARHATDDK